MHSPVHYSFLGKVETLSWKVRLDRCFFGGGTVTEPATYFAVDLALSPGFGSILTDNFLWVIEQPGHSDTASLSPIKSGDETSAYLSKSKPI